MKVSIVGAGNVAWHLAHRLRSTGHDILRIISPSPQTGRELAERVGGRWFPPNAALPFSEEDLVLRCVPDEVLLSAPPLQVSPHVIVAHTAGAVPTRYAGSPHRRNAVLYPFTSMTRKAPLRRADFPILVSAEQSADRSVLLDLAHHLTGNAFLADDSQRLRVHIAGVFANNFTNVLIGIAQHLASTVGPSQLLGPILEETVHKALALGAQPAQTGPARRGDAATIQRHLQFLEQFPQWREIYQVLSNHIQNAFAQPNESAE